MEVILSIPEIIFSVLYLADIICYNICNKGKEKNIMARDYIPSNHEHFNRWFKNIRDYVIKTKKTNPEWHHIPEAAVKGLTAAYKDWFKHYRPTLTPHTPDKTAARNEARRRAEHVLRPFVQRYLKWPPVTDADRANMELLIRDTTPTQTGAPKAQAGGDLVFPGVHMVEVRNIRPVGLADDKKRDKYGVRIHYGILSPTGEPGKWRISSEPRTGEDLPHSLLTRRKKHLFNFDGESANWIFICLCYENTKGERGPFGSILKAAIP